MRRDAATWIGRIVRTALAGVVVASLAALGVLGWCAAKGDELIVVRGASMGDAVPFGGLAIAERVAAERVSTGDVVVVARRRAGGPPPTPFVHRIVALEREGASVVVATRGDANARPEREPYVLPPVVLRVRRTVPYAGFAASAAATPWVRMATLALLVLVVAASLLRRILREPAVHADAAAAA